MFAADSPPRVTGTRSGMSLRTVTTRWSGRLRFPIPTEKSGCSVALTAARRSIWRRSPNRLIWRPNYTASNYHNGWTYQGGAFEQWFGESWTTGLALNTISRNPNSASNALNWTQTLPLMSYPVLDAPPVAKLAPYFSDWLAHPDYD